MDQYQRMLAGQAYIANDPQLEKLFTENRHKLHQFNTISPEFRDEKVQLIQSILGKSGKSPWIEQPFRCDYGIHIEVGDNFMANYNLVILDVAKVSIGNNVMFGPNVALFTAGHPLDPSDRAAGYEYGLPITIKDNVWLGGNVVVGPNVTIGENTVVGMGSVVTKDLPPNVLAFGNPCRVFREITDEDKDILYKGQRIDKENFQ